MIAAANGVLMLLWLADLVVRIKKCCILHFIRLLLQAPVVAYIEVCSIVAQPASRDINRAVFIAICALATPVAALY